MKRYQQVLLALISLAIVAFGQPVWSWWLGLFASVVGYALFWRVLLEHEKGLHRFVIGTFWGAAVQAIQLSWLLAHPYLYILFILFGLSFLAGVQFGFLSLLITKRHLEKVSHLIAIAALWTLMEWIRLFALAGFSFNPAGLALTGSLYALQMATLGGAFFLTFWVMLTNLFALHVWQSRFPHMQTTVLAFLIVIPYIFGAFHLRYHKEEQMRLDVPSFNVLLVQTGFAAEEGISFSSSEELIQHVIGEWKQILTIVNQWKDHPIDLIVLPEGTVPFGTYSFMYQYDQVKELFDSFDQLPFTFPFANEYEGKTRVNNAFFAQSISNFLNAGVVIGLEDASNVYNQVTDELEKRCYSAAQYFQPMQTHALRYEKRVLVPLGEYIPFEFCRSVCSTYGIHGSFTCGTCAKVFESQSVPFGINICYEETFGDLMRQSRQKGAELLVNVTNDVWYPDSLLPQQHFDHAKLRTVENGVPLVRSCNTGVTGAIDSLGRHLAILGEGEKDQEWISDGLFVKVPLYTYSTLYSHVGDGAIVGFCLIATLLFFRRKR